MNSSSIFKTTRCIQLSIVFILMCLQVQVYFSKKAKSQVHRFLNQHHLFHLITASTSLHPCSNPSVLTTHLVALFHPLATQTSLAARGGNCWKRLPQKFTTIHQQLPGNSKNRRRRSIFQDFNKVKIARFNLITVINKKNYYYAAFAQSKYCSHFNNLMKF